MPVIASVTVSHPDLVLVPTVRRCEGVSVEVVSDSGTDPESRTYSFLVRADDFEAFEAALADDHTVTEPRLSASFGDSRVYLLTYTYDIKLVSPKTSEVGGVTLEAENTNGDWRLQLQLPNRRALSDLYEYCQQQDIALTVEQVFSEQEVGPTGAVGVTSAQREALLLAYKKGYFQQPRALSLDELAAELDISSTAAGGRLRRGVENLIETTLVEE